MLYLCRCPFPAPVGDLDIFTDGSAVTAIAPACSVSIPAERKETALHREVFAQLEAYFQGRLTRFDLPLAPAGTPFQHRVWDALLDIPCGETRTYAQLAASVGSPRACRAVGRANARNPIPFLIPCHRVVASGGRLGGYALGLDLKQFLLDLERRSARI